MASKYLIRCIRTGLFWSNESKTFDLDASATKYTNKTCKIIASDIKVAVQLSPCEVVRIYFKE